MKLNEIKFNRILSNINDYSTKLNIGFKKYIPLVFNKRDESFYKSKKKFNKFLFFLSYDLLNLFSNKDKKYIAFREITTGEEIEYCMGVYIWKNEDSVELLSCELS